MSTDMQTPAPPIRPMGMVVVGWIISFLPALGLTASAILKLVPPPGAAEMSQKLGWLDSTALGLAIVEIGCVVIYLFPRTAVLGAVLLTGYLGGATATHVRIGQPFFFPILFAVLIWLGLLLRDARLSPLLPWRRPADDTTPGGGFLAVVGKIFLVILALVGLMAALTAASPAEFRITRSESIDAPPAKVFAKVNDFHNFDSWSPWKKLDPNLSVTYKGADKGIGAIYEWTGNDQVGAGAMRITDTKPDERITIILDFFKPFEATSTTEFAFKADGDKTIVTWTMTGRRDFVQKAFNAVLDMDKMLGAYFEEGLANLKREVEGAK